MLAILDKTRIFDNGLDFLSHVDTNTKTQIHVQDGGEALIYSNYVNP